MAAGHKFESTVRGKSKSKNELAKSFWDLVKSDPSGTTFAPGYSGPVFLLNNHWNYIEIGESAYENNNNSAPSGDKLRISPGKVDITVTKQYVIDAPKNVTKNYGTLFNQGIAAPKFDMRFTIWTAEQWGEFQDFVFKYVPTPKQPPKSYTIIHPALQMHKITGVTIWGLDGPYDGVVPRSKMFVFKCVEFVPPSQQTDTPAPDENIYSKYYADQPSNTMESTPGNTTAPSQPQGLQ